MNGLFQGDHQLNARSSLPLSIAGSGSSNNLANQRIAPSFIDNNNATLSVSDSLNALNRQNKCIGEIGGNGGIGNDASALIKVGIGGNSLFKGGNLMDNNNNNKSNGMMVDINKRKRSLPETNDISVSKGISTSVNDPTLLQRLNTLSGGFPMPKWARNAANGNGSNSGGCGSSIQTTSVSTSNDSTSISSGTGIGERRRKGMSIQEMMKERKRLELERVNNLSGGFPLPKLDADETSLGRKQQGIQPASLDTFRQVWLQTPPAYQKEVLSRRLERGDFVGKKKRRTRS
ncbi:unnamed protein product [Cylindrotheca closterium]|uniref:Uncharacterized protein n=1 Tax=Cylindrotheca closterium TaxID=2856 RepID=A0AAD2CQK0_9STRA|nr:unnamed protein product [Cylindrotheca closterium]